MQTHKRFIFQYFISHVQLVLYRCATDGVHDDLLTIVKRRKLRWYGHIQRSFGMAKTILQEAVKGAKRREDRKRSGKITQGMDRKADWRFPDGSGRQGKVEMYGCNLISDALTTAEVKGLRLDGMYKFKSPPICHSYAKKQRVCSNVLNKISLFSSRCNFVKKHNFDHPINILLGQFFFYKDFNFFFVQLFLVNVYCIRTVYKYFTILFLVSPLSCFCQCRQSSDFVLVYCHRYYLSVFACLRRFDPLFWIAWWPSAGKELSSWPFAWSCC